MSEPRIIRKYPNRRLYDTETAQFINTEKLRGMVVAGTDFRVIDTKTKQDLTRQTLLQILVEAEESGEPLLSEPVLRQMIGFYGTVTQSVFRPYLEAAINRFFGQQEQVRRQLDSLLREGPLGAMRDMAKTQSEALREWTRLWTGEDDKPR